MQLAPQTLLQGRYRIHGLIAQGGMGAVYRATDERLGNTVALKQTLVTDPQLRGAFEREARLLAGLHHPALPVVSDHFAEGSDQFLVMQFIPGDDLATLLQQRGAPFSLAELLPWADRLLDALDYLHGQRPPVIHRDIKPQNLKLTARGEIVLLDFGLAKGAAGQSQAGGPSLFGYTPQYAPLEQIQGSGTEERSDLYSAAATFYQLLTGEAPPDALTRAAASVNGQPDPLRPASLLNPAIPAAVSDLLTQAMALSPPQRPASAAAMRAALRAAASPGASPSIAATVIAAPGAGQPSSAGQPTIAVARSGQAAAPPARRTPGGPAMFALLIAGLVAFAFLFSAVVTFWPRQEAEGSTATAPAGGATPGAGGLVPTLGGAAAERGLTSADPLRPDEPARIGRWEVRVAEQARGEDALRALARANMNNAPPPEGQEYLLLRVEATLSGQGEPEKFDRGDIRVVGERGIAYTPFAAVPPDPILGESDPVAAGEVYTGWAAFLVGAEERNLLLVSDKPFDDGPVQYLALSPGAALRPDPALAAIEPTRLGADRAEPAELNDLAVTEDWEVTALEIYRGEEAWRRLFLANSFNDPSPDGFEFALALVRARYIGESAEPELIFDSYFTAVDGAGQEVRQQAIVEPEPTVQAALLPGGEWTGWVAVLVPAGDPDARLVFKASSISYDADGYNTRYFALQ